MTDVVYHIPALLNPCMEGLDIKPDGVYVDVTFGGGGHSREILKRLGDNGRLISFDQDADAIRNVIDDDRFTFVRSNFKYLSNFLKYHGVEKVDGIVQTWFLGTQTGHAIADVVLGKVNPSGKLPFTFPAKLEDNGAHALNAYHPDSLTVEYKESIYVGYRWAEKNGIKPLFAFGHGLSYTTFAYGEAKCRKSGDGFKVTVDVTNTGSTEGKEVVQLYISDEESSLERPVKELKGFKKIALAPGETKKVTFEIEPDMLKFYDPAKGWVLEAGKFTAHVGAASDDIRTTVDFNVK
jgi:hypothetical protein